jgi:hypothetical protein
LSTVSTFRYDIYRLIHKGLRACMTEALTAVGRIDCDDPREVAAAIAQTEAMLDMSLSHLEHENRFIHSAIEARIPGASTHTARDHVHHVASIATMIELCQVLARARGEERRAIADLLYQHLTRFVEENFDHMRHEEVSNNAALWSAYSDEEIHAIQKALVASIPPGQNIHFLRCMVRTISHGERVSLLEGIRSGAPAQIFEGILRAVEPVLSDYDVTKLHQALGLAVESTSAAA